MTHSKQTKDGVVTAWHSLRQLSYVLGLGLLLSCAAPSPSDSAPQGFIAVDPGWRSTAIPVCYLNAESAQPKHLEWVRNAVAREWEAKTPFRFTGWGHCRNAPFPAIRIQIAEDVGWSLIGASKSNSSFATMGLSVARTRYQTWCRKDEDLHRRCVEASALHEFGHAMGFFHEQDRPDSICRVGVIKRGPEAQTVGDYDAISVMNYCANRHADPKLSAGDIVAAHALARRIDPNLPPPEEQDALN